MLLEEDPFTIYPPEMFCSSYHKTIKLKKWKFLHKTLCRASCLKDSLYTVLFLSVTHVVSSGFYIFKLPHENFFNCDNLITSQPTSTFYKFIFQSLKNNCVHGEGTCGMITHSTKKPLILQTGCHDIITVCPKSNYF